MKASKAVAPVRGAHRPADAPCMIMVFSIFRNRRMHRSVEEFTFTEDHFKLSELPLYYSVDMV